MTISPSLAVVALWTAWLAYWILTAPSAKSALRVESWAEQAAHAVPILIAVLLIGLPELPVELLMQRFVPKSPITAWSGVALLASGLAFAVWARVVLGRNWSATVTIKAGHDLIREGPYRLVRHPIYTGALIAVLGTAVARGEWRGILAWLIVLASLWRKSRIEERWLMEEFGDRYARYRTEARAIIPYLL